MASEKKASEGIALLSMYGDEDDEMDDVEEEEEEEEDIRRDQETIQPPSDAVTVAETDDSRVFTDDGTSMQQEGRGLDSSYTPNKSFDYVTSSATGTPQLPLNTVTSDLTYVKSRKYRPTIVDYGHEEGPMSPEAEEGEIMTTGRVMYGEQLHSTDGEFGENRSPGIARLSTPVTQATPAQSVESSDKPESEAMNDAVHELGSADAEDAVMVSADEQKDIDPLDKFLPPPPKAKCSEELQICSSYTNSEQLILDPSIFCCVAEYTSSNVQDLEKIIKFLALKKTAGRSFNSEVRNRKDYRNPDFLLHAVTYQSIDQIGSCFSKDVFNPHGYDESDFYDEIEADMRREAERREQERKKSQKLDFTSGGTQSGNVVPTPKVSMPTTGSTAAAGVVNIRSTSLDITIRDGRQNKKSKWDKVDDDQRIPAVGVQENLVSLSAHTFLSTSKTGSTYSAYVQQKRKEAEEKRSSEKRSERRS